LIQHFQTLNERTKLEKVQLPVAKIIQKNFNFLPLLFIYFSFLFMKKNLYLFIHTLKNQKVINLNNRKYLICRRVLTEFIRDKIKILFWVMKLFQL